MRLCPYFQVTAHLSAPSIHHDSYKNVMAQEMDCGQGASSPLTLIMHNRRARNMYFSMVLVERTRRAGNNETR